MHHNGWPCFSLSLLLFVEGWMLNTHPSILELIQGCNMGLKLCVMYSRDRGFAIAMGITSQAQPEHHFLNPGEHLAAMNHNAWHCFSLSLLNCTQKSGILGLVGVSICYKGLLFPQKACHTLCTYPASIRESCITMDGLASVSACCFCRSMNVQYSSQHTWTDARLQHGPQTLCYVKVNIEGLLLLLPWELRLNLNLNTFAYPGEHVAAMNHNAWHCFSLSLLNCTQESGILGLVGVSRWCSLSLLCDCR